MISVLAIVTEAFGGRGGIARAARDCLLTLSERPEITSIDVHPRLTVDRIEQLPPKTVQRKPIPNRVLFSLRAVTAVLKTRPNVIFCNHLFMAPICALLAIISRARLFVQLHGTEVWCEPSVLQKWGLRRADLLICVSRDTRRRLKEHLNNRHPAIAVISNTVDEAFTLGNREAARKKFEIADSLVLLTVGRLDDRGGYKGHDRVIQAITAIDRLNDKDVIYLIAGEGKDRERLERLCRELQIENKVRFLGSVPFIDLPDLYRAADLFVMPSTGEGFGIVYIEAMACGTPAMGLDVGGTSDALDDGKLGILLSEQEDLAAAIRKAASESSIPSELSNRVLARFGRPTFQNRLISTLQDNAVLTVKTDV